MLFVSYGDVYFVIYLDKIIMNLNLSSNRKGNIEENCEDLVNLAFCKID